MAEEQKRVLVVDDEINLRDGLVELISGEGFQVEQAGDGEAAIELLRSGLDPDVLFLDIRMPRLDGLEVLKLIQDEKLACGPIIVISAFSDSSRMIEAMRRGAYDYIAKPLDLDEVVSTLHRAAEQRQLRQNNLPEQKSTTNDYEILGTSRVMRDVFKQIGRLAATDATALISGESGTGKELVARAIHSHSARSTKPFIAVNCGALPETLIEAELFGHERGAFTGADRQKKGRFELAHSGTLFLDEAGELTASAQVKLLRALQERRFERVGGTETVSVDVRVIAASNRDLKEAVSENNFRQDLFYRLSVVEVRLPPLRSRLTDVPQLAEYFLERAATRHGGSVKSLSAKAIRALMSYDFPGNVRELENIIERAVVTAGAATEVISPEHLFDESIQAQHASANQSFLELPLKEAVAALERELIQRALSASSDNRAEAARRLGINRRLLYSKLDEHGIKTSKDEHDKT